jgi:hypothetical protein
MNAFTIQETLLDCGDARVVLASDSEHGSMVGLSRDDVAGAVFVQIDRVTMLELERGTVDARTVIAERCAGLALNA